MNDPTPTFDELSLDEQNALQASRVRRRWMIVLVCFALIVLGVGGWLGWKLLDRGPSATEYYERAVALHEQGNVEGTAIELKNVLQQEPEHADARWLLGQLVLELGQGSAAQKEIEQAQKLGRQGPEVERALLRAMLWQGQFTEVLARLETMERDADSLMLRGEAQLGLGSLDKAKASFGAVLELDPDNVKASQGLARVALLQGDLRGPSRR